VEGSFPLRFVKGYPAVLRRKTLVIADLHLGIEREYWRAGVRASGLSARVVGELEGLLDAARPKKVIVAGDFKHNVPDYTQREAEDVRRVAEVLSSQGELIIVKGNHDGEIEKILVGAEVVSPGTVEDGVYVTHGHAHPSPDALGARAIVTGHVHPALALRHRFGRVLKKVYLLGEWEGVPATVLPAFSPLITGTDVGSSGDLMGPVAKGMRCVKAFLLDGTYVGEVVP